MRFAFMNILETERLFLRKPTVDDAAFMLRLVNEPSWLQYIGDRKVYTLEDAKNYLLNGSIKSFESSGFGFGIVVLKETGDCIGTCGLVKRVFLDDVDIGFAFFPEYGGKGYAFEVADATLQYAHKELGIKRIAAITTSDNLSSIKLLKKLGFLFARTILVEGEELYLFVSD